MDYSLGVTASNIITPVMEFITANIASVLTLAGTFLGLRMVRSMFNRGTHGRV